MKNRAGAVEEHVIASEGPPADALTAIDGGVDGFTNQPSATSWDVVCGKELLLSDLSEFLKELDNDHHLRSGALLMAISRLREGLQRCPEIADLDQSIELRLQDAAVIARALMQKLR